MGEFYLWYFLIFEHHIDYLIDLIQEIPNTSYSEFKMFSRRSFEFIHALNISVSYG